MLILWFAVGVAVVAVALGGVVFLRAPRHPAHGTFALGMAVVSVETILAALALPKPVRRTRWSGSAGGWWGPP